MKRLVPVHLLVALFAPVLALQLLAFAGCATTGQRPLDPAGVYAGDKLLSDFDRVIIEVDDVCNTVEQLAARNPAAVTANPKVAQAVARVRAERDGTPAAGEILAGLFRVRAAYTSAKTAENAAALTGEIKSARLALETIRQLIATP